MYVILFCLYLKDRFVRLDIFVLCSLVESRIVDRSRVVVVNYFFTRGQRIRSSRMNSQNKKRAKEKPDGKDLMRYDLYFLNLSTVV